MTATAVAPAQLGALANSAAHYPDGWHYTIDEEGSPVALKGKITSVVVNAPVRDGISWNPPRLVVSSGGTFTFEAPFSAKIDGSPDPTLVISDRQSVRRFALHEIESVKVYHTDDARPAMVGNILLLSSLGPMALSIPLFLGAEAWRDQGYSGTGGLFTGMGVVIVGVGVGIAIAGFAMYATYKKNPRESGGKGLSMDIGPGGGRLTISF